MNCRDKIYRKHETFEAIGNGGLLEPIPEGDSYSAMERTQGC